MIYCDSCSIEVERDEIDDEGRCTECAPCGECNGWGCEECGDAMSVWDVFLNLAIFSWTSCFIKYPYGYAGQKQFRFSTIWIYGDRVSVRYENEYHDKLLYRQRRWVFLEFKRNEIKYIPWYLGMSDFQSQMVSGK